MMFCSVFCSATLILLWFRWVRLSQRDTVGDKDLPVEVEVHAPGSLEELELHLGVLGGGLQDVLLGPIVQDQLHRESPVPSATVLGPRDLHVRDLTHPDRLLGVLLRHLRSLLPRGWQLRSMLLARTGHVLTRRCEERRSMRPGLHGIPRSA